MSYSTPTTRDLGCTACTSMGQSTEQVVAATTIATEAHSPESGTVPILTIGLFGLALLVAYGASR